MGFDGRSVVEWVDGASRMYVMPFERAPTAGPSVGRALCAPRATSTMWQLSYALDEASARALSARGGGALLAAACARCEGWAAPAVHALLRSTAPDEVTGYPLYDRSARPAEGPAPPATEGRAEGAAAG